MLTTKRIKAFAVACVFVVSAGFTACGGNGGGATEGFFDLPEGPVPKSSFSSSIIVPKAEASGTAVGGGVEAIIDYSHAEDGYFMVKMMEPTTEPLKIGIYGPNYDEAKKNMYQYGLRGDGEYDVYPFSDGSGEYTIYVFRITPDGRGAVIETIKVEAALKDEFTAFLRPNQYVRYTEESAAVKKGAEIAEGLTDPLEVVREVYKFLVQNFTYNHAKADIVTNAYIPDVDKFLEEGSGICSDYASTATAMLRSHGIPTKLETGYTTQGGFHAWISIYTEETGWINSIIFFDGTVWRLLDPTFASSGGAVGEAFASDPTNYMMYFMY